MIFLCFQPFFLSAIRKAIWKCATIEEIEAEKSSIEKDAVISAFLSLIFSRVMVKLNVKIITDFHMFDVEIKDGKNYGDN